MVAKLPVVTGAFTRLESASRARRAFLSGGAALALHTGVLAFAPASAPGAPSSDREMIALDITAITIVEPVRERAALASSSPEPSVKEPDRPREKISAPLNRSPPLTETAVVALPSVTSASDFPKYEGLEGSSADEKGLVPAPASTGSGRQRHGTPGSRGTGTEGGASGPRLLARGNPCAGYFPASAAVAQGKVRLTVDVTAGGIVSGSQIMVATPAHVGFSQAAVACASRLRFVPARTAEGSSVPSRTTLVLDFRRD